MIAIDLSLFVQKRMLNYYFLMVWQLVVKMTSFVNIRKWKASYLHAICAKKAVHLTALHTCT